jgi:hypothetical protein
MARLGELLVAARLLEPEQLERALRAQVLWGARLGTNLIELGLLDLDGISRALGRQHKLTAALARHFDNSDPELQQRLPAEVAQQWSVVPLLHVGPERKIAVAVLDPLPKHALAELADAFLCAPDRIVVSVAAEMRVRYHLERVYGIARDARFLRTRSGGHATPFPHFENVPVPIDSDVEVAVPVVVDDTVHPTGRASIEDLAVPDDSDAIPVEIEPPDAAGLDDLEKLIDDAIAQATTPPPQPEESGRDRRTYVRTLADELPSGTSPTMPALPATPLGRVAIKRVAMPVEEARSVTAQTFLDSVRAIRRATRRDHVAALTIDALERWVPACEAAMLLVVRGVVATSWKQFSRSGSAFAEISVPLDEPGLVPTVIERNAVVRGGIGELSAIDEALMRSLGELRGDLVVVPIAIADRVMAVIATATATDAAVEGIESVATAAATAFARLIRDASR